MFCGLNCHLYSHKDFSLDQFLHNVKGFAYVTRVCMKKKFFLSFVLTGRCKTGPWPVGAIGLEIQSVLSHIGRHIRERQAAREREAVNDDYYLIIFLSAAFAK